MTIYDEKELEEFIKEMREFNSGEHWILMQIVLNEMLLTLIRRRDDLDER